MSSRVIDISSFSENQSLAYKIEFNHFNIGDEKPIHLLIKGIAGSGKSYVIDAIRNLLKEKCQVLAYTGKASYMVNGITLHSFLKLPIGTKRLSELREIALQQLQNNLENVKYIIVDEYSFDGQNLLGWIDCRGEQQTMQANLSVVFLLFLLMILHSCPLLLTNHSFILCRTQISKFRVT